MDSRLYPQSKNGVKTRYVDGVLTFYQADGATKIFSIDPVNKKITYYTGATVEFNTGADLTVNADSLIAEIAALTGLDTTELGFLNTITVGSITASKAVIRTAAQGIPLATAVVAATGTDASDGAALTKDINLVTGADGTTCVVLPVGVIGEIIRVLNTVANQTLEVFPPGVENINGLGAGVAFVMGPGRYAEFICTAAATWYVDGHAAETASVTENNLQKGQTATAAEVNLLVGVTAGSLTASKTVTRTASQGIPLATAVVAALGTDASDGAPLTKDVNLVTGADGTTCVVLPVGVVGEVIDVLNTVGNQTLEVFPPGVENINGAGAGVAFILGPARGARFVCTAAATWYVEPLAAALPTVAALNYLANLTPGTQAASKAVVANADVNIGIVKATELHIGATGAEVQQTLTPTQANLLVSTVNAIRGFLIDQMKSIATLVISAVPEKFKTTTTTYFLINGIQYSKVAADNLVFSAANTINTGAAAPIVFGAWLVQTDAAGTISTKPAGGLADQVYANEAAAIAALPAADANNVALGYITVSCKASTAWIANTDDLTNGSDCTVAAFYNLPVPASLPAVIA